MNSRIVAFRYVAFRSALGAFFRGAKDDIPWNEIQPPSLPRPDFFLAPHRAKRRRNSLPPNHLPQSLAPVLSYLGSTSLAFLTPQIVPLSGATPCKFSRQSHRSKRPRSPQPRDHPGQHPARLGRAVEPRTICHNCTQSRMHCNSPTGWSRDIFRRSVLAVVIFNRLTRMSAPQRPRPPFSPPRSGDPMVAGPFKAR